MGSRDTIVRCEILTSFTGLGLGEVLLVTGYGMFIVLFINA